MAFRARSWSVYHFDFPGDWNDLVQEEVNDEENVAADLLHIDFWDGMTSVDGYGAIRFFDSIFYKDPAPRQLGERAHLQRQPGPRRLLAPLCRTGTTHPSASSSRRSAGSTRGPGTSSFDDARSPEHVAEQLLAFRKWGMGGEFANYAYAPLADFDYEPYVAALKAGSKPGRVDDVEPTLELTETAGPTIEGTAHDNLAIRAVRWRDNAADPVSLG